MAIESLKWLDKIISDVLDSVYSSVNERLDKSFRSRKIPALRNIYLEALYERVRYINLPHISIPREITDLFVELYVFRSVRRWQLEAKAGKADLLLPQLLRQHKHLFVLGEPGAGKTTFMRRVAYSICKPDNSDFMGLHKDLFPIYVECRHSEVPSAFSSYDKRLKEFERRAEELRKQRGAEAVAAGKRLAPPPDPIVIFAAKELEIFGFPYAEKFVEGLLDDGRVIIFIDGLDEAPVAFRKRIVKSLESLRSRYPSIHLITTCRTAEAELVPSGFAQYEIAPLTLLQREKFARKWFSDKVQVADFLEKVSSTHIWDVSDRPLLLTLLCALYQSGGDLPRFKVDLYKECVELALRRWDTFRNIKRETAFNSLSLNQRLNILARIGAQMTLASVTIEAAREIDSWFKNGMEENGVEGNSVDLREEIVRQSGLIFQVALDKFSFSHKSLQEYFAALHFSKVDPMLPVTRLLRDRQWLATAEMTACMVSDAGKLLFHLLPAPKSSADYISICFSMVLRILTLNPVTISAASREQLVQRIVAVMYAVRSDLVRTTPILSQRFKKIEFENFSPVNGKIVNMDSYGAMVYVSWRDPIVPGDQDITALSLGALLLLRLLIPAQSTADTVRSRHHGSWIESVLASVSAHVQGEGRDGGKLIELEPGSVRLWPFRLST